ncbi:hypothetical protein GEMRC1_000974 [Eukaryota sp. GEM-RC1]
MSSNGTRKRRSMSTVKKTLALLPKYRGSLEPHDIAKRSERDFRMKDKMEVVAGAALVYGWSVHCVFVNHTTNTVAQLHRLATSQEPWEVYRQTELTLCQTAMNVFPELESKRLTSKLTNDVSIVVPAELETDRMNPWPSATVVADNVVSKALCDDVIHHDKEMEDDGHHHYQSDYEFNLMISFDKPKLG